MKRHWMGLLVLFAVTAWGAGGELHLRYDAPAPLDGDAKRFRIGKAQNPGPNDGWEKWSLPIGCGWFGVNVFGRTGTERLQITENTFCSSSPKSDKPKGLGNFMELYLDFDHKDASLYQRTLDLETATAGVSYQSGEVVYTRELFTSHADRVLAIRLTASKPGALSFTLRPELPFGGADRDETYCRIEGNRITLGGVYGAYKVLFEGEFALAATGGRIVASERTLRVEEADSAVIIASFGTNYRLSPEVFTAESSKKLAGNPHPHAAVSARVDAAVKRGYDALRERHLADYQPLFNRVALRLGDPEAAAPETTDRRLAAYRKGAGDNRLEALYFQYGRYLLISSSRPGTLPANLQGVWNCYDRPAWGSGYFHNINLQMNYWPAFVTNLAETFDAYIAYQKAYEKQARRTTTAYLNALYPGRKPDGDDGWMIGVSCSPYFLGKVEPDSNSGPATNAFTTLLFWEAYAFSGDPEKLKEIYPVLKGAARSLNKILEKTPEGKWLVGNSASPEHHVFEKRGKRLVAAKPYRTVGTAFDQCLVWECFSETLAGAELLGDDDALIRDIREKLPLLDPVQIGADGQIKEFREENHYAEVGDPNRHYRHISQLVGVYPGSFITPEKPELLKAAAKTLDLRGDVTTGWGIAHRMNAWARIRDGKRAHDLLRSQLTNRTNPNLWDAHPPFQVDGNLGASSAIAEMLIQSHLGKIELLPALPPQWESGEFSGLRVRGGFTVGAVWEHGKLLSATVRADRDGECRIALPENFILPPEARYDKDGVCVFNAKAGIPITFGKRP